MRPRVSAKRRSAIEAVKTSRPRSKLRITTVNCSSGCVTEISYVCSRGWNGETCIRFSKVWVIGPSPPEPSST
jgi:hypothetical protein